jgi:hypothetical protein
LDLVRNGKAPTRGFLHMIEPRIHWLIDLSVIDKIDFFEKGVISPGGSLKNLDIKMKSFEDYKIKKIDIMRQYLRMIITDNPNAEAVPCSFDPILFRSKVEDAIQSTVYTLSSSYTTMIPLDAVIIPSMILSSLSLGELVSEEIIVEEMKKKYTIYRDYLSGPGFLSVK